MQLLRVHALHKRFAGVKAIDDVALTVERGEVHSIIGPNGAGKSTLVNMLTGRLVPDAGEIHFDNARVDGLPAHEISQRGVARVFQSPEVYPELTLHENVALGAFAARDGSFRMNLLQHPKRQVDALDKARDALHAVGLGAHARTEARHLSRGDKRRLELAICLACEPRLLLLDEPTAGMSPSETRSTVELLQRIGEQGLTMVVIEHDMSVVFALSHRITVLQQGRVIASGEPQAIREDEAVYEAYLGTAPK